MKTTQYTPGPWNLDAGRMIRTVSGDFYLSYKTDKATSAPAFQNFSELDANAHLISAAPDLLSALEEMMSVFQDHEQYDDESAEVVSIARAAIAKAKGAA